MSQFSVFLDADGNLTMAAGVVHCLHGTTTYFPVGGTSFPRIPALAGGSGQRSIDAPASFQGGSGRNYLVSGGPANDDLPKGFFKPTVPDEYKGPKGAKLTRDPGTGALSLHDGTDELATGSGIGGLTGAPSAGTFPVTEWLLSGHYEGYADFYQAVGLPGYELHHDLVSGEAIIKYLGTPMITRAIDDTGTPAGVYDAEPDAETEFNGGSPWSYTIATGGLSGTLTATAYAETAYNGGSPFTLDIEAESTLPAWPKAPVDFSPYVGTAQAGLYDPTGWQAWQSQDDPDWTITLDGSGAGSLSDGVDIVATRAADATRLYDPSGEWTATTYGETTYNGGDAWFGNITRSLATPMAGKLYIEITVDGSNEVTAVDGPFFATSLPANSSTLKVILIAECDGSGVIRQVWEGPIQWQP